MGQLTGDIELCPPQMRKDSAEPATSIRLHTSSTSRAESKTIPTPASPIVSPRAWHHARRSLAYPSHREWNKTFANDNAMTAAGLDRVVHHCETVIIEGDSYRLKDRVEYQA